MRADPTIQRLRHWYAKLIRLYPDSYRARFGAGMLQTFVDCLRERADEEQGLLGYACWVFVETSAGIVRERKAIMFQRNKRLIGIVSVIVALLMVPLVAMQFTDEVNWSVGDFVIAGVLLFGTGLLFEFAARKAGNTAYRAATGVALVATLVLIWLNLAVGLIGSEDNPANVLYLGVIQVGIIGAGIARFRPQGMSRTMFAMATAQALVPILALIIWKPALTAGEGPGLVGVFMLNGFFVALFLLSGFLFREAVVARPN